MPKKLDPKVAEKVMLDGGWKPLEPYKSASIPWKSECLKCGLIATPTFANVQNGSGCTICKNSEKDKPTKYTEEKAIQLMLNAGLQPLESYKNTKSPWKSKCLVCEKITTPMLGNIIRGHKGCGFCDGHKIDPEDAVKKMRKAGLEPLEPYASSDAPWKCRHLDCGAIVSPSYASIRSGQGGCRSCGFKESGKKNTLDESKAKEVMLKAKLQPLEPYTSSSKPWKCECMVCHKIVFPTYSNINSGNSGCLYCSGGKVDAEDAIALMREHGLEPLEPFIDSKKKWKCRHLKCGNIVYPQYNTIQNRGGGCSACAEYGLNYTSPAYLYIMKHEIYQSIKVGISNIDAQPNRVRSHEIQGWKLYKVFNFATGQIAEDIENEVLNWLRSEKGLGIHLTKDMVKQGGYSETTDANEITLLEIDQYLNAAIKGLQI